MALSDRIAQFLPGCISRGGPVTNTPVPGNLAVGAEDLGDGTGAILVGIGSSNTSAVGSGVATNTVIKNRAGRLAQILVTVSGANQLVAFDHPSAPSGTIIGFIAASSAAGTIGTFNATASGGITLSGASGNPGVTVYWS